ncbi:MAG: 50S ribosomal protein L25 [Candidatus Aminicenantes bacterium]|nr:MAG: 50S ribosomal protein L25 [Candidatus Aminicenantes bacterium]
MSIKAESRQEVGKRIAKQLRKQGKIPAIIYGENKESIPISIAINDVKAILKGEKGENTVLRIHRDDIEVDAMLKEIQYDYLSDHIIHVDFLRINLDNPVTAWVPVTVTGEPIGVKVEDGIFDFITRDVQVKCLPTKIPKGIEIDVAELHAGHSIKAEDMELAEDIQLLSDPQRVICAVTSKVKPAAVEEKPEAEEEAAEVPEEQPEADKKEESPG